MRQGKLLWPALSVGAAVAIALAATVTGTLTASGAPAPACSAGTTVTLDSGPVCGLTANSVTSWQGIRYAAAPVGNLRWASPQPPAPWTSTFQATTPGNPCPQGAGLGDPSTNEDCLNLNVRVPANPVSHHLPVMVQFHGGGFVSGAASDGTHLALAGQVISVEVNYRLGIFGFLADRAFGPHAGDWGLQDEQASLRWVQRNITRFGGDPHNVTIYGASAGGSSVCDATASPTARGLFQKGISESGEYNSITGQNTQWQPQDCHANLPDEAQAQRAGDAFAANVGCASAPDVAACLRAVSVPTLLAKAGSGLNEDNGTIAPIVNGTTLTESPGQAFTDGHINNVSLMIGVARDETQLPSATTAAQYTALIAQQFGPLAPAVERLYPLDRFPDSLPFTAYRTIIADSDAVCPALLNDRRLSQYIPVYAYEMDDADAPPLFFLDPTKPNGSYHVDEVPLLFPSGPPFDANQQALSDQLTAQWTGFARTGNPTVAGTPQWDRFSPWHPSVMSLVEAGDSTMDTEIAQQHNCGFWDPLIPFNGGQH
jgi:para-nitrobenzyl esterase